MAGFKREIHLLTYPLITHLHQLTKNCHITSDSSLWNYDENRGVWGAEIGSFKRHGRGLVWI